MSASSSQANNSSKQIAVIDRSVEGYHSLVDAAQANGLEVVLLSGDGDGFVELAEALAGRSGIDGIHLFSHGSDGNIHLGRAQLSRDNLEQYADALETIKGSLSSTGDVLIYGCDVAGSEAGEQFVAALAERLEADVAASDDVTGNEGLGGDWELEVRQGDIDATSLHADSFESLLGLTAKTYTFDSAGIFFISGQSTVSSTYGDMKITASTPEYAVVRSFDSASSALDNGADHALHIYDSGSTGTFTLTIEATDGSDFGVSSVVPGERTTTGSRLTIRGFKDDVEVATAILFNDESNTASLDLIAQDVDFANIDKLQFQQLTKSATGFAIDDLVITSPNNAPVFVNSGPFSIVEDAANGAEVGDVNANDGDGGGNDATVTYSIVSGNPNLDSDGDAGFAINTSTGVITVNDAADIDFDSATSHTLSVRATDSLGAMTDQNVTVSVTEAFAAPTLTVVAQNPTFTENGSAADLFNSVTAATNDDGQTFTGTTLTVTNVSNGAAESLSIAGTSVALTQGGSGSVNGGGNYAVSVSGSTATVTLTDLARSNADMNTLIDGINYSNTSEAPGTASRVVSITQVADSGINNKSAPLSLSSTVTVVAVNDAPVLADQSPALAAIYEDLAAPVNATNSTLVSALTGGISDVDTGDAKGIAITATNSNEGTLYYSIDNGASWSQVSGVSDNAALLLEAGNRLYWQPVADKNGTVSDALTFRAWDVTAAEGGDTENVSNNGGSTAYSTATDTVAVTVTNTNDAPVLDSSVELMLATIAEDPGLPVNGTTTNSTLVSTLTAGITDIDPGAKQGIAITAADSDAGTLYFSTDEGANWTQAEGMSETKALLLEADDHVYWLPTADSNGAVDDVLTFRAWDVTTPEGAGTYIFISTNAYSSATDTVGVNVTPVNDAPTITNLNGDSLVFTEGDDRVKLDVNADATLTDIDSAELDGGTLTIAWQSGRQSEDRLLFDYAAAGNIELSSGYRAGSTISLGGQAIGSIQDGGTGRYGEDLVVSLSSANATVSAVQSLIRAVQYYSEGGDDPTNGDRVIRITLTDGDGGTSNTNDITVNVNPVNDAPVLDASASPVLTAINEDLFAPGNGSKAGSTLVSALTGGISDVDSSDARGIAVTAMNTELGTLHFSTDEGATWSTVATDVSDSKALTLDSDDLLYWQPNANVNGTLNDALSFRAWDLTAGEGSGEYEDLGTLTGTSAYSSTTDTVAVTVNAVNDAPTITTNDNFAFAATDEDTASAGSLVSAILAEVDLADVDSGAHSGIAVTAVLGSNKGSWQFSTEGATWTDFGTVSETSALLLSSATQVRFVPDGANSENPDAQFTFRAWDQTSGTASSNGNAQTADTTSHGGSHAFSADTATTSIAVSAVNDAPALDSGQSPELETISEDLAAPVNGSTTGSTLVSVLTGGVSDVDTGARQGVAITATNSDEGMLYYSVDGGVNWSQVGAVSETSALLLDADDRLYWQPSANNNGTVDDALTFRAWDLTGAEGGNTENVSSNGGSTAYSTATDTVAITVNAVNDAPTLDAGPVALTGIDENTASAASTVSDLLTTLGYADVETANGGVAVTAAQGHGHWQYSTDNGGTWHDLGTVSTGAALLLENSSQVRYTPDNANGETNVSLSLRAWDGSSGTASSGATRSTADTAASGGSTAFSSQQADLEIAVSAVNDAPTLTAGTTYTMAGTDENAANTAVVTVATLLANAGRADVDTGAESGLVITDAAGRGDWQYSLNTGETWTALSDVSTEAALALGATAQLRYQPDAERGETATLTFRAWDQSNGTEGTTLDASSAGDTTALSTQSGAVSVTITGVNDAPTGDVELTGTQQVGSTLTVAQDLADVDGLGTFSYQWKANDVVIADADASSLLLSQDMLNKKIAVTVSYTDLGGTDESVSSEATVAVQSPPPPGEISTIDGAQVNKSDGTAPDGSSVEVTEIGVISDNRQEQTGEPSLANIPLVTSGGSTLLEVGLPSGVGMRVESQTGAGGLIAAIRARTNSPQQQADRDELTGAGSGFLGDLPDPENLIVRTVVPTVAAGSNTGPAKTLTISAPAPQPGMASVALVIDTRSLPAGTVINLDNVQFAAVIGDVRLSGGSGTQIVSGDGGNQIIVLGEDDDILRGGAGDDLVGSREGADRLYGDAGNDWLVGGSGDDILEGGAGNDVLQGGASDAGSWQYRLQDGELISHFTATEAVAADAAQVVVRGPWWTQGDSGIDSDDRAAFTYADPARLELVASLYKAATGERAGLMDFNAFVNSGLSAEQLADEAVNFFFASQGPLPQALEVQLQLLIEAVWGEGSATDALISEGVNHLNAGGSWGTAMLFLARAQEAQQLLRGDTDDLILVQDYQTSETGWSANSGHDTLRGGAGNDRLVGGDGDDLLDGGEGTDVAVFTGGIQDFLLSLQLGSDGRQEIQLTRKISGEVDTLISIELLKVGGFYYGPADALAGAELNTDYELGDAVVQLTAQQVQAMDLAGIY